jgi:hypothetical protein
MLGKEPSSGRIARGENYAGEAPRTAGYCFRSGSTAERHCGYPVIGSKSQAGFSSSVYIFQGVPDTSRNNAPLPCVRLPPIIPKYVFRLAVGVANRLPPVVAAGAEVSAPAPFSHPVIAPSLATIMVRVKLAPVESTVSPVLHVALVDV